MAVFPQIPRVIKVEIFVNNVWTDITSDIDVRNDGAISISGGGKDEQSRAGPSSCLMTIDNRSGNYSPRNPVGIYWGSLGRNTPVRVTVELAKDTFTRTVSSGWGSTDTGQAWSITGLGGPVSGTNFNVTSSVGTVLVPSVSSYRYSWLATTNYSDIDVAVTVTLPFTDVTGGAVEPANLLLRGQSFSNYYMVRVSIDTAEVITMAILHVDGSILASATATGLTHVSSQSLRVRAQAEGSTIRAKVWAVANGEPYSWTVTANSTKILTAGWVGLRSGIAAGNTNIPVTFSYDDLTVRNPRFSGEMASWPQRWDITGNDVFVPIQASGIKRRLGQGATPVRSSLYRHYKQLVTPPVAYWSMEDPANSGEFASEVGGPALTDQFNAVTSGAPLVISTGAWVTYAGNNRYVGSAPLPVFPQISEIPAGTGGTPIPLSTEIAVSDVTYTATGQTTVRFLFSIPFSTTTNTPETPNDVTLIQIITSGTSWYISYITGGFIKVSNSAGYGSGAIDYGDVRGRDILYSLQLTESGANVNWNLALIDQGASSGLQLGLTATTATVGVVQRILLNASTEIIEHTIGHIAVRTTAVGLTDITPALSGHSGEAAGVRVQRLCSEEGISFAYRGDIAATQAMGPQGAGAVTTGLVSTASLTSQSSTQTLLDLLYECEDVEDGILYELRGTIGLGYRTRTDLYSQTASLTMNYALGQVAQPFEPVDDDQLTRNNILVTRVNALSVEAELTQGRMSTLDPSLGGVGRYDTQYTINAATDAQLTNFATFLLSRDTVDEARYPTITINLANPNVVAAGLESSALAVKDGDLVVITNPKTGVNPDQIRQIVQGYTEILSQYTHSITFNCSPETPYRVGKYDASPTFRYDTLTSRLVSGVNSSATSLSVSNVNEPWTTDSTQWPISITVSGEEMSVTAVVGGTTPQTFTVTRSVNGVVKAQLANAVVRIHPRSSAIYAL